MRTYKRYGTALGLGSKQEAFNVLAIGLKVSECGVDCLASESKFLCCHARALSSLFKVCKGLLHNINEVGSFLRREAPLSFK